MKFEDLSFQIITLIIEDLDYKQIYQLCALNSTLNNKICFNSKLWNQKYLRNFSQSFQPIKISQLENIIRRIVVKDNMCSITVQSLAAVLSGFWDEEFLKQKSILDYEWGEGAEPIPNKYFEMFSYYHNFKQHVIEYDDKKLNLPFENLSEIFDSVLDQLNQNSYIVILIYFADIRNDWLTHGFVLCNTNQGLKIVDSYINQRCLEIRDFDLFKFKTFLTNWDISLWNDLFHCQENPNLDLKSLDMDFQIFVY